MKYWRKQNNFLNRIKLESKRAFLVFGQTDIETREKVRKLAEEHNNIIIIASLGVYAQGVNIKNLHDIIFAEPFKSKIKVLQSIGRGLRKHHSKDIATLWDISDYLKHKKKVNYSLRHFLQRVSMYDIEEFEYTSHNVNVWGIK